MYGRFGKRISKRPNKPKYLPPLRKIYDDCASRAKEIEEKPPASPKS